MTGIRRFVAVGDSFTEGMSDDLGPDGRPLGWADRVAAALARTQSPFDYANLAVRGKLLDQVVVEQLPDAVAMAEHPAATLVSFHAGANDVLRLRLDLADLLSRYDRAVHLLARTGVRLLLFTAVTRTGGSGRTSERLGARFAAYNEGVRATAERYGAVLQDNGRLRVLEDRRLWADDRLHLAPEGHRRVAAGVLGELGVTDPEALGGPDGWWRLPLAPAPVTTRRDDLAGDLRWVRGHLLPWVARRVRGVSSGDGMPAKRPRPGPAGLYLGPGQGVTWTATD